MSRSATGLVALRVPLLALAVVSLTTPVSAQMAYTAANGPTSVLPWQDGFFGVDFTEAEAAVGYTGGLSLRCAGPACVRNRLDLGLYASVSARKGQQDLLSNLDFLPGFDVGGRIGYVVRHRRSRWDAVFLRVTHTGRRRNTITENLTTGLTTLGDVSQRTFAAAFGFNHAFSETTILGVGFEGRRELSSPGVQGAREYCTPGNSGPFRVLVCADRYVGPLQDLWEGQARADLNVQLRSFGSNPTSGRLGLISAASIDFIEGEHREVNVAIGPSIDLPGYAGQPILMLLLGLRDVFDARNLGPAAPPSANYLDDHFLVRLALAIPFGVVVKD